MRTFADLPSELARRVAAGERVVCVLLDAFGMRFLERYGDHPFLGRLTVTELATQFPSTTTAHITTMNTGLPVEQHGFYEWNVYEPAAGEVVTPLRDAPASVGDLPSFYEQLGGRSVVASPSRFSPSRYDRMACRGAEFRPYEDFAEALRSVGDADYTYVYLDAIDMTGHVCGPSSREFDDTVRYALDALEGAMGAFAASTLVVTADHGQIEVDPARTLWLDELWPALSSYLLHRPAGSARDCFLHVRQADVARVADGLREAVGDGAVVLAGEEVLGLFAGPPGPRLLERVGDVCVLPEPGRMAWLRSASDLQTRFLGHHGGTTPEESGTWFGLLQS